MNKNKTWSTIETQFFFITKFAFQIILLKVYTCNASNELCRLLTYKMKKVYLIHINICLIFKTEFERFIYKYLYLKRDKYWQLEVAIT